MRAYSPAPGEACLRARVARPSGDEQVLVHWELARDPDFRRPECYGLRFVGPLSNYDVSIDLHGLEPGRPYWYRLCAHGSWSAVGQLRTSCYGSTATGRAEDLTEAVFASAFSG